MHGCSISDSCIIRMFYDLFVHDETLISCYNALELKTLCHKALYVGKGEQYT